MSISATPADFAAVQREIERYEARFAIAVVSGALLAAARLAMAASSLLIKFDQIRSAVDFDSRAVKAVEMLPDASSAPARSIRVKGLRRSGMNHLLLGHVDLAVVQLQSAQRLVDDSVSPRLRANVHWDSSMLDRWRHDPLQGLAHALRAWEYYVSNGPVSERRRLRVQIAELAMDLAVSSVSQGAFTSFDAYLHLAEHHLVKARSRFPSWFVPDVDVILPLAYARFSRLTNRNEDRIGFIDGVLRRSARLYDSHIQGQAVAAFGDELAWLGRLDDAKNSYRSAIDILSPSLAPGLALLPRSALARLQEFRDN